jgi:hypothetical protein
VTIEPLTDEDIFRYLWNSGEPITSEHMYELLPEAEKLRGIEEEKSIVRALKLGRGVERCCNGDGTITFRRLCDDCGKQRGPMWIVRPEIWRKVMPRKEWQSDICLHCWQKRKGGS